MLFFKKGDSLRDTELGKEVSDDVLGAMTDILLDIEGKIFEITGMDSYYTSENTTRSTAGGAVRRGIYINMMPTKESLGALLEKRSGIMCKRDEIVMTYDVSSGEYKDIDRHRSMLKRITEEARESRVLDGLQTYNVEADVLKVRGYVWNGSIDEKKIEFLKERNICITDSFLSILIFYEGKEEW